MANVGNTLESCGIYLKSTYQELFRSADSVESAPPQLPLSLARVLPVPIERSNIWDEFTKSTVRGSPDDLLHLKEPIDIKGLLGLLACGQKNIVLLEGSSGTGKTTLLLSILKGWSLNSFLQEYLVVVYVPLWDASIQSATSLEEILQSLCKSIVSRETIVSCMQQNGGDGVIFFLDGWQEACEAVLPISSLVFDNSVLPRSTVVISTCPAFSAGLQQHASARVELVGSRLDTQNEWLEKSLGCVAAVQMFIPALEANPVLLSVSHFPSICEALTEEFVERKNQLPLTVTELLKAHLLRLCSATFGNTLLADTNLVNLSKLAFDCFLKAKEIITTVDLESFHLDSSALPRVLKHVSLSSSSYKFSTPLFQHFLVAFRIAQFCPEEQCGHLKAFLGNPRHSELFYLVAGLTKLNHSKVQSLIETLVGESLGEPQCLVLLRAIFEAQRADICKLVASSLCNEIILSSLYLSPPNIQAVGYFAACSSQFSAVELHLRKCSLDDKGVGILMHYLEIFASKQPTIATATATPGLILNLQLNRITPPGTESIARALQNGVKLLSLNVGNIRPGYNNIRDPGAEHLCRALASDVYLVELCLSNNSISAEGAIGIGRMLVENNSLQKLDIQGNIIGEKGTIAIAESLKHNSSLRSLNLYCCYTADGGAKALANALTINTSIVELNLSKNEITGIGAAAVGSVLAENCSLKQLNFCSNWIDDSGLECITSALQTNTRLTSLDVKANTYTDAGRRMIAACLKDNQTVCMLRMDCPWVIGKELKEINAQRKEQDHKQLIYKF